MEKLPFFDRHDVQAFVVSGTHCQLDITLIPKLELCFLAAFFIVLERDHIELSELWGW